VFSQVLRRASFARRLWFVHRGKSVLAFQLANVVSRCSGSRLRRSVLNAVLMFL
jgi:hypothetical protein